MDSDASESTESEDNENTQTRHFNERQVEELLICLKDVLKTVVCVLKNKKENYKVAKTVKENTPKRKTNKKGDNGNIAHKKDVDRCQNGIQQLCCKIKDISSSVRQPKSAVPGNLRRNAFAIPGTSRSQIAEVSKAVVPWNRSSNCPGTSRSQIEEVSKAVVLWDGNSNGSAAPAVSRNQNEDAVPQTLATSTENTASAAPKNRPAGILTHHLKAVASRTSKSQTEANVPEISTIRPKVSKTTNLNHSKAVSGASSSPTPKNCTGPDVAATSKSPSVVLGTLRSHIEGAVPGSSKDNSKKVTSTTTNHIEAVRSETLIAHTETVAPETNSSQFTEVPAISRSDKLVMRQEKQIQRAEAKTPEIQITTKSHIEVQAPETPKSHFKSVVSSAPRRRPEEVGPATPVHIATVPPTASKMESVFNLIKQEDLKCHTKAEVPKTPERNTEAITSAPTRNQAKTVVPGSSRSPTETDVAATSSTQSYKTKAEVPKTPASSSEAIASTSPRSHTNKAVKSHKEIHVPATSRNHTEVIKPETSKSHTKAELPEIARVSTEVEVSETLISNSEVILLETSTSHKEPEVHETSEHSGIHDNGSDIKKRRKSQDNYKECQHKRKKQDPVLTLKANDDSRENNEKHGKNVNLQRHNEPIVIASRDNNRTGENTTETSTNTNLKRIHAPSNDDTDTAKRARIGHKCRICTKTYHDDEIEEHYKKMHYLHHEIKHNREHYEHKFQDLDNRLSRRTGVNTNVVKAKNNDQLDEDESEDSRKTTTEETNTAPNERVEQTNALRNEIATTDKTSIEERKIKCKNDSFNLTREENECQDSKNRLHRCRDTDININVEYNNKVHTEKAPEIAKTTMAEITNTVLIECLDHSSVKLTSTCIEVAESDINIASTEEKSTEDPIDLTSDDNDEFEVTIKKAMSSTKPIEEDQILNEHEIIDLCDDVFLYDLPEDEDRSVKGNVADIEKNNNIEIKDNLKDEPEIAYAEELLATNVKKEQARNQDGDKDENIVQNEFFNIQSNILNLSEASNNLIEKLRERQDSLTSRNDKIQARRKSSKEKLENHVNETNNDKLTSALTSNNAPEFSILVPGSTSAIQIPPIQKDRRKSIENHNNTITTTSAHVIQSGLSRQSTPTRIGNLSISIIPATEPKLSSTTELPSKKRSSVGSLQNSSQHISNTDAGTATSKNRPEHALASKPRKIKNKPTKTQNTVPIGNLPESPSTKRDLVSAQNPAKHRKLEKKSKTQNTIPTTNLSDLDISILPGKALPTSTKKKSSDTRPLKPIQLSVIQSGANIASIKNSIASTSTGTTALTSVPSTKSKYSSEPRQSKPKEKHAEKPAVNLPSHATHSNSSPNTSMPTTITKNSRQRVETCPVKPTQQSITGINIPFSTSYSTPTPMVPTTQFSLSKSKPTLPIKSANRPLDPRPAKPVQQSIPQTGTTISSTFQSIVISRVSTVMSQASISKSSTLPANFTQDPRTFNPRLSKPEKSLFQTVSNIPSSTSHSKTSRASIITAQSSSSKPTALPTMSTHRPSDPRVSKPELSAPQTVSNIPSTSHSTTSRASTVTAQASNISKPTIPKSSNRPLHSRLSQSVPHHSNLPSSTSQSTFTPSASVAFPSSKPNPSDLSKHARRRHVRHSVPQPTSSSSHLHPAYRIRLPSTDTQPTQSNSVSTSSRRASLSNVSRHDPGETNPKYRQRPQTSWRSPPRAEIIERQGNTQNVTRPIVARTDARSSEAHSNRLSHPILTPRPSSDMLANLRIPSTSRPSWHTPEERPGIDITPAQRPAQPVRENMSVLEYLNHAGSRDPRLHNRFAAAYTALFES